MSNTLNDRNTVSAVSRANDRVASMLQHFSYNGATWDEFGKAEIYMEELKLDLSLLLHCVEARLQETYATHEPQEFGT